MVTGREAHRYISNHGKDPEQSGVDEVYLIEARAGAVPRRLVEVFSPNHQRLAFSPGRQAHFPPAGLRARHYAYITDRLAVVSVGDGHLRRDDKLDRAVAAPFFAADGKSISVLVEDDGSNYPARVDLVRGRSNASYLAPLPRTTSQSHPDIRPYWPLAIHRGRGLRLENRELRMLTLTTTRYWPKSSSVPWRTSASRARMARKSMARS